VSLTPQQIKAVKEYRNRTGCSLIEARNAVVGQSGDEWLAGAARETAALRAEVARLESALSEARRERDEAMNARTSALVALEVAHRDMHAALTERDAAREERDVWIRSGIAKSEELTRVREEARAARAALRRLEWSFRQTALRNGGTIYTAECCPACMGERNPPDDKGPRRKRGDPLPPAGHKPDCWLAAAVSGREDAT
jgi:hypothetical protein